MSGKSDTAVERWLQRPYVGERYTAMGPNMTNAGVAIVTTFLQATALALWYFIPVRFPFFLAFLPLAAVGLQTAVLLLYEPGEQRPEN